METMILYNDGLCNSEFTGYIAYLNNFLESDLNLNYSQRICWLNKLYN